jgi:hypothetical protein
MTDEELGLLITGSESTEGGVPDLSKLVIADNSDDKSLKSMNFFFYHQTYHDCIFIFRN